LVCGTVNAWGQYINYIASWLRAFDPAASYNTLVIVLGISVVSEETGLVIAEWLKEKVGPRKTMMIGGVCLGGGLILASAYPSIWLFLLCYGIIYGVGIGINENIVPEELYIYFPDNPGKAVGAIFTGFGFASLVFGLMFSYIVNPSDESPGDVEKSGKEKQFYYGESVYERVPMTLQIVGAAYILVSFIAAMLLQPIK
jgi:MFS family permease